MFDLGGASLGSADMGGDGLGGAGLEYSASAGGSVSLTPHRYWRVYLYGSNDKYTSMASISMAATAGGANQCIGKTASASDSAFGLPGDIIGGTPSTYHVWRFGAFAWWQCDFGSAVTVAEVKIGARTTWFTESPVAFSVAGSDDGITFTNYGLFNNYTAFTDSEVKTFTVGGTALTDTRSAARIWFVDVSSTYTTLLSMAEMELATSAAGLTITTGGNGMAPHALSTTYIASKAFDTVSTTYWIAAGDGGGPYSAGKFGYVFASAVAPTELRIRARDDGFFAESPKNFKICWSSDGINFTVTDTVSAAAWTAGLQRTFPIS